MTGPGERQQHQALVDPPPLLVHRNLHDPVDPACGLTGRSSVCQERAVVERLPGWPHAAAKQVLHFAVLHTHILWHGRLCQAYHDGRIDVAPFPCFCQIALKHALYSNICEASCLSLTNRMPIS